MNRTVTLIALGLTLAMAFPGWAYAQQSELGVTVTALQGVAQAYAGADQEPKQLQKGSSVDPWEMVSTDAQSKAVLQWQNGLTGAVGEFSSLVLSAGEMKGQSIPTAEIVNGIFRFAGPETGSSAVPSYSVTTPAVSIYPVDSDQPVDFTVEVYDPQTTVISVISGQVRVRKTSGEEQILPQCQSLTIEEDKVASGPVTLAAADFSKLIDDTTIPGTLVVAAGVCGNIPEAVAPKTEYSIPSDYYVEDWDDIGFYPDEVRVMAPPHAGGAYVVVIPGFGQWFIEIPYQIDPIFIQVYVQQIFLNNYAHYYHGHLAQWRHRQHELAGLISLARTTGNTAMLMQAQRQLNDLNLRTRWAAKRIGGIDNKLAALKQEQHKFSGKLPKGPNLDNLIAASLNAPRNAASSRKFQERLKTDVDVQKRFANLASQEIANLNRKIAAQQDPAKRLALREQLSGIRNQMAKGKLILPDKDKQVGNLVKELGKERDPGKQLQIQDKVLNQLKKAGAGPEAGDLINQQKLATMKQELSKIPSPQGRQVLERQLSTLQQSVEKRKETDARAEQTSRQMDQLATQAAGERNPERRSQILNQLNELSKSVPGALPRRGFLPPSAAGIQPQVPPQPGLGQQQKLEEQRRQTELQKQQQHLPPPQLDQGRQTDLKKQEELRRQDLQRQQAIEKQKQEQELKKQQSREQDLQRQKQQELKQQATEKQKQEQELKKQQSRQQELERQKQQATEKQKQEKEVRNQQLRQQELERQRQTELKQQERLRDQQLQRQRAEEQKRQQEIQRRNSQEQAMERQRQLGQERLRQQQLQQQQSIELQQQRQKQDHLQQQQQIQQQQMRRQQEQQRGMEMRRQQQEQQQQLQRQAPALPQGQPGIPQTPRPKGPPGFPGQ